MAAHLLHHQHPKHRSRRPRALARPDTTRGEDRVRNWKNCGLANLSFEDFTRNQAWCAVTLLAGCPLAWTQHLCLDGPLTKAEPKTLRHWLLHIAARLVTRGRQTIIRIDQTWPWRHDLATAYTRLRAGLP